MRVLAINSLPHGSTGNIMVEILKKANEMIDADVIAYYGAWNKRITVNNVYNNKYGFRIENRIGAVLSRITGFHNVWSILGSIQLLYKIKKFKPDIVHLHNLHLWNINLPMLFGYIKKNNVKVIWTLHDCWSFTGQCPHFTMVKCDRWMKGCHNCPQYHNYPGSIVDQTRAMWKLKRKWFTGVKNLTIVTPSHWLADLVKQSYLQSYPLKVINNGIDLGIFKPIKSNFRKKYGIKDNEYIILGVAFGWSKRKGLDVFTGLSKKLPEQFKIVLVGTDDNVDKLLPDNIISIHKTQNQKELAEIYSAADVFVNPTREDNYPTVNMEAIACGTPVITYRTGGSPEMIDSSCGYIVDKDNEVALVEQIKRISFDRISFQESCLERAEVYDMNARFREYVELYKEVSKDEK